MMKHLLVCSALGIGLLCLSQTGSTARAADREEWVKYNECPREVRDTLDRERRNHEIKRIDHVIRNGREFYRATIDTRGEDTVVRVDRDGRVLSRDEVADTGPAGDRAVEGSWRELRYAQLPDRVKDALDRERNGREIKSIQEASRNGRIVYQAIIDERRGDRIVRLSESGRLLSEEDIREARSASGRFDPRFDERGVRRDFREMDTIPFDRLPGGVKATLGREAGPDRVGRVVHYRGGDYDVYRAEIDSPNGTRVVRVDGAGRIVGETETVGEGKRFVRLRDLPGAVQDTIGREVPRGRLGSIVQITRDGRTYWRAEIDEGATSRWLTINEAGRVTGEIERPDR